MTRVAYNKKFDTCQLDDCSKPHQAKGYCQMHYRRNKLYNDPYFVMNTGKVYDRDGYVAVRHIAGDGNAGKYKYEHRLVMEEMIGRELLGIENVHHKNGIRSDNRPDNLELWSRRQPPGQRVEDKVEYAIEILKLYAPDLLKEGN